MVMFNGWVRDYWNIMNDIVSCGISSGLDENVYGKDFYDGVFREKYELIMTEADNVDFWWNPVVHYGVIIYDYWFWTEGIWFYAELTWPVWFWWLMWYLYIWFWIFFVFWFF